MPGKILGRLLTPLKKRRVTNAVRYLLDDWLPPVVRELRPLNRLLAWLFHGPGFDLDFKEKAFTMSDAEIAGAYARLAAGQERYRQQDTTPGQVEAVLAETVGPRVLEVGCGNGMLTELLAERGHRVVALDVGLAALAATRDRPGAADSPVVAGALPRLPFADASFDTVVCNHTVEHIPDLHATVHELRRVTAGKLLVVTPRQRYYRYTIDYHLHFFPSAAELAAMLDAETRRVDGDWLFVGRGL